MTMRCHNGWLVWGKSPMKKKRTPCRDHRDVFIAVLLVALACETALAVFLEHERRQWRHLASDYSHQLAPPFLHPPTTGGPE